MPLSSNPSTNFSFTLEAVNRAASIVSWPRSQLEASSLRNLEALENSPMSMVLRTRLFGGEIPTIRAALCGIRLFLPEVIGAARAGNDMCRAIIFKPLVSARAAPSLYAVDCILSSNSL